MIDGTPYQCSAYRQPAKVRGGLCSLCGERVIMPPNGMIVYAALRFIEDGAILMGTRHSHIIKAAHPKGYDCTLAEQGFVTSGGEFVGRAEARRIAVTAGQAATTSFGEAYLYSEDLKHLDGSDQEVIELTT